MRDSSKEKETTIRRTAMNIYSFLEEWEEAHAVGVTALFSGASLQDNTSPGHSTSEFKPSQSQRQ